MYLGHQEAGLGMQQLALGSGVEQEGVAAEGEGPIQAKLMLGLVMRLPPRHVMVLDIQLLTVQGKQGLPEEGFNIVLMGWGGAGG